MVHFEKDYVFGTSNQKKVLPLLNAYFKENIQEFPGKWSKYDFHSDTALFELKSRKIKKDTYPTTLLTCNKVVPNKGKNLKFLFKFTDELCYLPYDEEIFNTFDKQMYSRVNQAEDEKEYYFIPIEHLKTIQTYG